MKKIFFGSTTPAGGDEPFWKPWGAGSWLLRLLLFLLLLFLLILLLNLFRKPAGSQLADDDGIRTDLPDPIINPDTPDPVRVPVDTTTNFPHDIQHPGPFLPSPEDNNLPPITDDEIIIDDGHRQIVGDRLNVILDSSADDETFRQWSREFHDLYPDSTRYRIIYYDRLTKLLQIQVPAEEREEMMEKLPTQITDISFKVFPEGLMGNLQSQRRSRDGGQSTQPRQSDDERRSGNQRRSGDQRRSGNSRRPNDPVFSDEETAWYFEPIQAYEAWEITKGSPDVVIAICDSYFDLQHDDLNSDRIVKPYSVMRRTGNVAPANGCDEASFLHGSMVSSQALGNMDNGRGTAGIAPKCKFMPVSLGHEMSSMVVLQGLLYAIYQGASVVNLSIGDVYDPAVSQLSVEDQIAISRQIGLEEQSVWEYVAKLANERNVTIVWAAGNENVFSGLDSSKRGNATIKVSAVDKRLRKADFSNFGNFPEYNIEESTISAPGVDIVGAKPYNTYDIGPGTSFAAPIVTGAVALMKSLDASLTTAEIIDILQQTGKPVAGNTTIGKLLQIKDALELVKSNFANFSDLMNDHNSIVGLWQSTRMLPVTNSGQPTDDWCRQYFNITSTSAGQAIYYAATQNRLDYTAPLAIQWQSNKIVLHQEQPASNATANDFSFTPATFTWKADSTGRLQCEYKSNTESDLFYLRKIARRND